MGINLRLSSSANGTRNVTPSIVNMGGGSNLIQRSLFSTNTPNLSFNQYYSPGAGSPAVSTADYYNINGLYRPRPWDLDTMGSEGATIKAREGKRYVWIVTPDHPGSTNYQGSSAIYVGYSNDPQVFPESIRSFHNENTVGNFVDSYGYTQNNFNVYQWPSLVYNPDSAGDKFWIYLEGASQSSSRQHELGLITTSDFLTSTLVGPVIATANFNGWASLGYVTRTGVNTWEAITFGNQDGSGTTPAYYKYTSSDGLAWTQANTTVLAGPGEYTTISGQKYLLTKEGRSDNDYVSLLAVDSSNVSLGTYTRISSAFGPSVGNGSHYPGPTYLQDVSGYEEDGILTIYATRGYFTSGPLFALNEGPYLGISPTFFDITGSITSNVLDVTAVPPGSTLAVGQQLLFLNGTPKITSFGTGSGGTGTYNISSTSNRASGTINMTTNGGLWQQFVDLYYYVTDPAAAAGAAPFGVTADCVSGTVTISWHDCLPNRTYRVYRGTDATTQAALVGDVTGISITDTPTPDDQYFYKVVTMNGVTEEKSRVVSVYASNNELMVNRHVNRVINDGGDTTKIDMTFLASVAAYLTSNDYWKYLMNWVDARFGVKLDGSGFVSKVYCLGTTRLPKGGDYTPTTSNTFPSTSSNTSYSATSFRGTTPSWINNAGSAHGYFGNGRANNIQRKNQITMIAAYQKPGTSILSMLASGQFGGIYLQHASGSSGNVVFAMTPAGSGTYTQATVPFASATAAHVAAGVFDGSNMTAILDGVSGAPVDGSAFSNPQMASAQVLRGDYRTYSAQKSVLASGGQDTRYDEGGTYTISNHAQATFAALVVMEVGSASIVSDVTAMYA